MCEAYKTRDLKSGQAGINCAGVERLFKYKLRGWEGLVDGLRYQAVFSGIANQFKPAAHVELAHHICPMPFYRADT